MDQVVAVLIGLCFKPKARAAHTNFRVAIRQALKCVDENGGVQCVQLFFESLPVTQRNQISGWWEIYKLATVIRCAIGVFDGCISPAGFSAEIHCLAVRKYACLFADKVDEFVGFPVGGS